jgi:hypothetical protein
VLWINAKKSIAPPEPVIVIYPQRQLVEKDMAIRAKTKNVQEHPGRCGGEPSGLM